MIEAFTDDTALLLIDVQKGVDNLEHWGGPTGLRNNLDAEANLGALLAGWRAHNRPVVFTRHDSAEANSPLKLSLATGEFKDGFEPSDGEIVITKSTNGAFFGTDLELQLRRLGAHRLMVAGFFTNMCVETTVRTAGNLAYDTYLCPEACATTNRVGPDGVDHDAELVHQLSVASLHGEFCTALTVSEAMSLLNGPSQTLSRAQGNE